jgi:hypothetical protein
MNQKIYINLLAMFGFLKELVSVWGRVMRKAMDPPPTKPSLHRGEKQDQQDNQMNNVIKCASTTNAVLIYVLGILENRREQLATRSTVCLAASSGLFVLIVNFITDATKQQGSYYHYVVLGLIVSLLLTGISIIDTLDLVKRISRKKSQKKTPEKNILFFGWIATQTEDILYEQYSKLCNNEYIKAQVRQSISLSKNLHYRYLQLRKSYTFFVLGLVVYISSILFNIAYKYNIFSKIAQYL